MFDSFDSEGDDFLFDIRPKPKIPKSKFRAQNALPRKTSQICTHFLENKCVLGSNCFYTHRSPFKLKKEKKMVELVETPKTLNKTKFSSPEKSSEDNKAKNILEIEKEPTTKNKKAKIHSHTKKRKKRFSDPKITKNGICVEIDLEKPENIKKRNWDALAIDSIQNRFHRPKSRRNLSQEKLTIFNRAELTFSKDKFNEIVRISTRKISRDSDPKIQSWNGEFSIAELADHSANLSLILSGTTGNSAEFEDSTGSCKSRDSVSSFDSFF